MRGQITIWHYKDQNIEGKKGKCMCPDEHDLHFCNEIESNNYNKLLVGSLDMRVRFAFVCIYVVCKRAYSIVCMLSLTL